MVNVPWFETKELQQQKKEKKNVYNISANQNVFPVLQIAVICTVEKLQLSSFINLAEENLVF